jgi:hypothetical protein
MQRGWDLGPKPREPVDWCPANLRRSRIRPCHPSPTPEYDNCEFLYAYSPGFLGRRRSIGGLAPLASHLALKLTLTELRARALRPTPSV